MIKHMPSREYHAIGRGADLPDMPLSKSLLWKFGQSPFKWKAEYDAGIGFKPTPSTEWGSLVDCLVTQPCEWQETAAIGNFDNWLTKEAKAFKAEAAVAGKIPVLLKQMPDLERASQMLREHLARHCTAPQYQIAATHEIAINGCRYTLRGLADIVDANRLHDIKTTESIDESKLRYKVRDFGYHVQAAFYIDLFRANGAEIDVAFDLHFQESSFPFRTRLVTLTPDDIRDGREWYANAIQQWHTCVTTGEWPGAELEPMTGGLPRRIES